MITIFIYDALAIFGAAIGSFIAATVWRMRAGQLQADKAAKREYDKKEYTHLSSLMGRRTSEDRSQCLHCKKQLRWFELIPIVSWVAQKGKCRSCKKPIGRFEIITEVGLALFFVVSYALWQTPLETPLEIAQFILWLAAGGIMTLLFAYDMKWFLLPDSAMIALIIAGSAMVASTAVQSGDIVGTLISSVGAVAVLAGLYAAIYFGSKGRWIGLGDVILGVGLGLLLGNWQLALVALFMANFIGCLIVIPLMIAGKLKRNAHVPFGPLLIAGTVVAWFFGTPIIEWYLGGMGLVF